IAEGAPVVLDFLCDECKEHHAQLQAHLDAAGLKYTVNPQIVRGLDYYTKTVFEFVSGDIGAQSTVCGGGRYDGLIAQLGGPSVQSVGFAMGLERLMMVLEAQNAEFPEKATCDIYFAPMGENEQVFATKLCAILRAEGFEALSDINGRGLRAQLKYANKIGAKFTCVLGEDEVKCGTLRIKNMQSGEETEVSAENIVEEFYKLVNTLALDNLTESVF
ncbi:MAG: histidine--tRNA ligase, partial [Clostridia bacterium]|nr:histidine--tRNA ligase [Clostridia bacterium]